MHAYTRAAPSPHHHHHTHKDPAPPRPRQTARSPPTPTVAGCPANAPGPQHPEEDGADHGGGVGHGDGAVEGVARAAAGHRRDPAGRRKAVVRPKRVDGHGAPNVQRLELVKHQPRVHGVDGDLGAGGRRAGGTQDTGQGTRGEGSVCACGDGGGGGVWWWEGGGGRSREGRMADGDITAGCRGGGGAGATGKALWPVVPARQ